ncbi:MAG: cell wall-binding repeat-containing protein [Peptococcaceae bacterium]|nr:cell wall-binding repeat-containing protein [Peptococcaceae bacterium]
MRLGKVTSGVIAGMMVVSMACISPALALAAGSAGTVSSSYTQLLNSIAFMTNSDSTLIAGEVSTVNIWLYDQLYNPFNGSVVATLTAPDGTVKSAQISGGNGAFAVSGLNPLTAGTYTLTVSQSFGQIGKNYTVQTPITVLNAVATAQGSLVLNTSSQLTVKLTDSNGKPLANTQLTVDSTGIGGGSQTFTTLSDGTCDFSLTPSQLGTVYFEHGGLVVGSISVTPGAASVQTSGALVLNTPSLMTVTLLDPNGNPVNNKNVTLDESGIGGGNQSYTTLNDGTFRVSMTPTKLGTINIIYGANIVGSIVVQPAYVSESRIGASVTNNVDMSVAVAQKGWTSAKNVILTRQDVLVDAMTAIPLAKQLDAPILMTPSGSLSSAVLAEISNLQASHVYIIGGDGAVSSAIESVLKSSGLSVTRLGGSDRYATAVDIAQQLGSAQTVYLAYGYGEPDAIMGSVFAAEQGYPVLLTNSSSLSAVTKSYLSSKSVQNVFVLGGDAVVTPALEATLQQTYHVTRLGGSDRYYTEQAVGTNYFANLPVSDQYPVYFTSSAVSTRDVNGGTPDASALLAGDLAAKQNGILLMVAHNYLPDGVNNFLLYNKAFIPQSTVVGNMSDVSASLEQTIDQVLSR